MPKPATLKSPSALSITLKAENKANAAKQQAALASRISFRKVLLKLHLYISLWFGALLVIAGITGSILVYDHQLDTWLNDQTLLIQQPGTIKKPLLDLIAAANNASAIKEPPSHLQLPGTAAEALIVRYQVHEAGEHKGHNHHFYEVMLNQYTGEVLGQRDQFNSFMALVLRLHFNLFAGETGQLIMGLTSFLSLILIITGIYLWWPKLKWTHLKKALTIKTNGSNTRLNFDLHKTVGIYTAIVLFSVSLSGVYFNLPQFFRPLVNYFSPLEGRGPAITSQPSKQPAIQPEAALTIVEQKFPGIELQRLFLPTDSQGVYQIMGRQTDEPGGKGGTMLWIDQYTGQILKIKDPHQLSPGNAFINLQLPLHNGEILGAAGRIMVLIAGFAPLLLMITGTILWLRKRSNKRQHAARVLHNA